MCIYVYLHRDLLFMCLHMNNHKIYIENRDTERRGYSTDMPALHRFETARETVDSKGCVGEPCYHAGAAAKQ